MIPPHLPPKIVDPNRSIRLRRIKILLAITAFSLLAGASGASMMLGWIWPKYADGDTWITSYSRPPISKTQLEDRIREEMSERVAFVYQGIANSNGTNYLKTKIGDAVIVGSDGWLAMYKPDYVISKDYYILLEDGTIYQPEKAIFDKYAGFVYLKIKSGQHKVVSFSDDISQFDDAFIFDEGYWKHANLLYRMNGRQFPHLDTAPGDFYELDGSFKPGQVVINNQGRVIGIITNDGLMLPIRYVSRVLPDLLSRQVITYPSLGVEGWFSEEQPIISGQRVIKGFAVTKLLSDTSALKKGDVILEIDGRVVTADSIWYNINNKLTVNLKIMRGGKTLDISASIIKQK